METNMDASMDAGMQARHEAESSRYFRRAGRARKWSVVKKIALGPLIWVSRNPLVLMAGFLGGAFFGTPMGETLARSFGWGGLATLGTSLLAGGLGAAAGALAVFGLGGVLNRAAQSLPAALAPDEILPASGPEFVQRAGDAMSMVVRGLDMTWAERQTAALGAARLAGVLVDAMRRMPPWEGRDVHLLALRNMLSMPPMEWGRKEMNQLLQASNAIGRQMARIDVVAPYQHMKDEAAAMPFGKKDWQERYLPFLRAPMKETGRLLAEIETAQAEAAPGAEPAAGEACRHAQAAANAQAAEQQAACKEEEVASIRSGRWSTSSPGNVKAFSDCDLAGAALRSRRQADAGAEQDMHAAPG